jgi:hypothetical protein
LLYACACTVSRELLTKADAKILDKKANLESVRSGFVAQEEALKGVSTAFSQVCTGKTNMGSDE